MSAAAEEAQVPPQPRAVRFASEAADADESEAELPNVPAAGEASAAGRTLGVGHVRMTSEELNSWAQMDLAHASEHRSTQQVDVQEALWAAEAKVDGRANWSVREAVRLHAFRFRDAVADLHAVLALVPGLLQEKSSLFGMPTVVLAQVAEALSGSGAAVEWVASWPRRPAERATAGMRIAVRKRPLLDFERQRNEWDCVEADARAQTLGGRASVLCHDGRVARNGKQLTMSHRRYVVDQVWDEHAGNEQVSREAVLPLLRWARGEGCPPGASGLAGHAATLLCYGQTGTGKTHTLGGALDLLASELDRTGERVEIEFFEVRGQKLHDLLRQRAEVLLRSDEEGRFHLRGAARIEVTGGAALCASTSAALELRASEATERNPVSSRSHAVLVVWMPASGGMLRFVDLAGSERNYETEQMSAAQHRESAEINASLMALKECFRAHAALQRGESKVRMPYRSSRLTQCLRECFEDPLHRFTLIATVSPSASDVIHTTNTLNHAVMMALPLQALTTELIVQMSVGRGRLRDAPVAEWTAEEVAEWAATVERGRFAQVVLPPGLDGKGLLALSSVGLAQLFERDLRRARGEGEGTSWNVTGYEDGSGSGLVLGRALFAAVRREALASRGRSCKAPPPASDFLGQRVGGLGGS